MTATSDIQGNEICVVAIDSRGKSPSDLECYKELTTTKSFFEKHILTNPKNLCFESQVAGLCGLDLKVHFHEHSPEYSHHSHKLKTGINFGISNGAATLLTFNPDNGLCEHVVRGKAYVVLDDGKTPISSGRVWGIQEMIREARLLLYHKNDHVKAADARNELLKWCEKYREKQWVPRSLYESMVPRKTILGSRECDFSDKAMGQPSCKDYRRADSGVSDQATCHHGCIHTHHDGHHDCCHGPPGLHYEYNVLAFDPVINHHIISYPKDD